MKNTSLLDKKYDKILSEIKNINGGGVMSNNLIESIIKCFEEENENREYYKHKLIDIPFYVSVLEQNLNNDKYKELHKDLEKLEWHLVFLDEENYYINSKIQIVFEDRNIPYSYMITFEYDNRYWGYCQCSKEDADYDARYDCCGHGCDWSAPKFSITKETYLGSSSFKGDEHDYWDFKDNYYSVTEKDKQEQERLSKIKALKEEKAKIEKELNELENV